MRHETPFEREKEDVEALAIDVRRLSRDARSAGRHLRAAAGDIGVFLKRNVEVRPATTLIAAAGAGALLATRLPWRVSRWTLEIGGRLAMHALVQELTTPPRDGARDARPEDAG